MVIFVAAVIFIKAYDYSETKRWGSREERMRKTPARMRYSRLPDFKEITAAMIGEFHAITIGRERKDD